MRSLKVVLSLALLSVAAEPLAARDLPVPPDKGWQHARTGLILTASLAGLPRTALRDSTETEHDVSVQFEAADSGVIATVYLFRPAIADVALWFDRSQTALEKSERFGAAVPATAAPIAFATGGATDAVALRQVYSNPSGDYRSTAIAIMPLGDWLVAVRLSAKTLTAAELDAQLLRVIAGIRWPKRTDAAATAPRVAIPVKPCANPLTFGKAKQVKTNGSDVLMALLGGMVAQKALAEQKPEEKKAPPTWCREGVGTTEYGVYRSDDGAPGYVIALYDSGQVARAFPSLMGRIEKTGTYTITLTDVTGKVSTYPSFSAMPAPKQIWDMIGGGKRVGTTAGQQITLDPKAM